MKNDIKKTSKIEKANLNKIIEKTILDAPKETILGKMASAKGIFNTVIKSEPISNRDKSINKLELLRKKLNDDLTAPKSENPLDQNIKEIAEEALSEICLYFRRETGSNINWLQEIIYNNWKSGRKIKHDYEQRIRSCQLIYFLINQGMSKRQAFTHADKIYGFNETDGKHTYPYFLQNLEKYYFSEIEYKEYDSILIFIEIIQYGKLFVSPANYRKVHIRTKKAKDLFENIFHNSIELLKKEINYAQTNKLEKIGVQINPIISKILNQKYLNSRDFIAKIQSDKKTKWEFAYFTRNFLYDMDLYHRVK